MTQYPQSPKNVPRAVPTLLSFVAGYVDSITFLALFGFFAAQVTGSFIVAGSEIAHDERGLAAKLMAVPAFMSGVGTAALLVITMRGGKYPVLTVVFLLELILLAAFAGMMFAGWPITDPDAWSSIAAGLLAAAAMGVQSALVRLLLRDVPQTNVMTGNATQLAIDATEIFYAWIRPQSLRHDPALAGQIAEARKRIGVVFFVLAGFLTGALAGALAYAYAGPWSVGAAIAIVGLLIGWSISRRGP
jgi:uncharacterized membrane protein YoaK (UPF0700 family)